MTDAIAIETVVVEGLAVTVPLLVWRRWRRPMPGMVAQVLDINRGLADLGPVLPLGTVVRMPVPAPEPVEQRALPPLRLW